MKNERRHSPHEPQKSLAREVDKKVQAGASREEGPKQAGKENLQDEAVAEQQRKEALRERD